MSSTDCDRVGEDLTRLEAVESGTADEKSPLSRPAGLIVAVAAALCVTTAIVHMCMVFLYVAPSNIVSQRYQRQINGWVYPYFEQNWQLFAPNPESAPEHVSVRTRTTSRDGVRRTGGWVDLTAMDDAAVHHDPFPSHTAQNMLRRAWGAYADASGDSDRARMLQRYLLNIATRRLAAHGRRGFDAVQLRVVTTPIGPESRPAGTFPPRNSSSTRYLPWWQVNS